MFLAITGLLENTIAVVCFDKTLAVRCRILRFSFLSVN